MIASIHKLCKHTKNQQDYFLQFWHFKNIFYSKFWNCFNICFHTWIWSQFFFQTLEKTQSLASFSPQGIFFKFYYLECFRKFKILNFFQLFCSISWSWFFKKKVKPWNWYPKFFSKIWIWFKKKIHEFEIYSNIFATSN